MLQEEAGRDVRRGLPTTETIEPALDRKVEFLSKAESYPHAVCKVIRRETHMSWVFLAGDRVYKLKKPVRFRYLDFSTLQRREAACRAELRLNRRLAPDVYLKVVPLTITPRGLSLGGKAMVVDWLVVMRRLDEQQTLEHAIEEQCVKRWQLDVLAETLVQFYRRVPAVPLSAQQHLLDWHRSLAYNRQVLLDSEASGPPGLARRIDFVQRWFLKRHANVLVERVHARCIVDGHGDLRPEHIWLGDPVRVIDCLEFNPRLRAVDPFDEIAFLSLECERLGAVWAGEYIRRRMTAGLRDGLSAELFLFYRCHRATLRARLAIAHLFEPNPRTPEKWARLAREYLRIATADATRLERSLKTQGDLSARRRHAAAGSLPQGAARRATHLACCGRAPARAEKRARRR
jgi:aminoglycoside phosphotransferase family enzyme